MLKLIICIRIIYAYRHIKYLKSIYRVSTKSGYIGDYANINVDTYSIELFAILQNVSTHVVQMIETIIFKMFLKLQLNNIVWI